MANDMPHARTSLLSLGVILLNAAELCHAQPSATPIADAAMAEAQKAIVLKTGSSARAPRIRISAGSETLTRDGPPPDVWQQLHQWWPVRASVEYSQGNNLFAVGAAGYRGNTAPAYMTDTLSTLPIVRAFTELSGRTTWSVNARVERVLRRDANGNIVTALTDVWLPVRGSTPAAGSYNAGAAGSKAVRGAVRFRF